MEKEALQLAEYVLDSELLDFIEQLSNEESYIEDEILTDEESYTISDRGGPEDLIKRIALNPKCTHPYALAYRICRKNELDKLKSKHATCWYDDECRLHRTTGPAVLYLNGDKEYWIEGVQLTEKEYRERDEE